MICKNLEIIDCLISVKMNSHSLERTIKPRVLEAFGMVCNHGCELFKLKIELIDIELNVTPIELIVIELIDME